MFNCVEHLFIHFPKTKQKKPHSYWPSGHIPHKDKQLRAKILPYQHLGTKIRCTCTKDTRNSLTELAWIGDWSYRSNKSIWGYLFQVWLNILVTRFLQRFKWKSKIFLTIWGPCPSSEFHSSYSILSYTWIKLIDWYWKRNESLQTWINEIQMPFLMHWCHPYICNIIHILAFWALVLKVPHFLWLVEEMLCILNVSWSHDQMNRSFQTNTPLFEEFLTVHKPCSQCLSVTKKKRLIECLGIWNGGNNNDIYM